MTLKPNHLILLSFLLASSTMVSCYKFQSFFSKKASLKSEEDKKSYSMGYLLGNNIKRMENNLIVNAFLDGMKDSLNNKKSIINQDKLIENKKQLSQSNNQKGEQNMIEGQKFLAENSKKEGVKVTNSGLQYEVLKEGSGNKPLSTDTVEVHYRGTLINGTEFDSSYKRNKSTSFPLNRVIKGWTEGVQLMKQGSKYKFFIPSELGYGSQGGGGVIPPNATLIFEVELLNIL